MVMELCAACKQRVEDGSIRCPSCDTRLDPPGAFMNVLGWVVVAVSTIPFAISEVTTSELDFYPLAIGLALLAVGVVFIVMGRVRSKSVEPKTVPDTSASGPVDSQA